MTKKLELIKEFVRVKVIAIGFAPTNIILKALWTVFFIDVWKY